MWPSCCHLLCLVGSLIYSNGNRKLEVDSSAKNNATLMHSPAHVICTIFESLIETMNMGSPVVLWELWFWEIWTGKWKLETRHEMVSSKFMATLAYCWFTTCYISVVDHWSSVCHESGPINIGLTHKTTPLFLSLVYKSACTDVELF